MKGDEFILFSLCHPGQKAVNFILVGTFWMFTI